MHILGIAGSMRKDRFTAQLAGRIIRQMEEKNPHLTSEMIHISEIDVQPCRVTCSRFCSGHAYHCSLPDDVTSILKKMQTADALVIGTPLYFRAPPAKFQSLVERLISIFFFYESAGGREPSPLLGKPCGLVGVAEYANPHQMLEYLHDFCMVLKMKPVVLNTFPYLGVGWQGKHGGAMFNPPERSAELAHALLKAMGEKPD